MHTYDFIGRVTEKNVKSIILEAGYVPANYTYTARVDKDGWVVQGNDPMAISRLEKAARDLGISVEIYSAAANGTALTVNGNGHGNGNGLTAEQDAAGTVYHVDFQNDTPDTWTLAVYQTLPSSPGLDSVSWKQTTTPRRGESGVEWSVNYLVGIVDYKQDGGKGVYKASQKLGTNLGQAWEARMEAGAQQLFEAGNAPEKGQVVITNRSGKLANLAIGMDGDIALVQPNVYGGNAAQFTVTPTYYVALFKDIVKGQIISGNQVHGPLQVVFRGGATTVTYRASIDGANFVFEEVGGVKLIAELSQVQKRVSNARARSEMLALR